MSLPTIDFHQAEQATQSIPISTESQYQPQTMTVLSSRADYLPSFPRKNIIPRGEFLLANVPVSRLSAYEQLRRQHAAYSQESISLTENYNHQNRFSMTPADIHAFSQRLHVPETIVLFNADRLDGMCRIFLSNYAYFRRKFFGEKHRNHRDSSFNSKNMSMLLEFYLQMDVDLFYMKTCSFRDAQPRSNDEGIFCGINEPEARYSMTPCHEKDCSCCYPYDGYQPTKPWTVVDFSTSSTHRFLNGYTTYLNCPATCETTNIIYVMTCPCGEYEFVDSTDDSLGPMMEHHRYHCNRLIHEKLTGNSVVPWYIIGYQARQNNVANRMRLYRHTAGCPIALEAFIDCNPTYRCFIPMNWYDAALDNAEYLAQRRRRRHLLQFSIEQVERNNDRNNNNQEEDEDEDEEDNPRVSNLFASVPEPSTGYDFSYQQRKEQREFFRHFITLNTQDSAYRTLNLYQYKIIAVLPQPCLRFLRYAVQTLFSIHGETKLNMILPPGLDPDQYYGPVVKSDWPERLRRCWRSTTRARTTTEMPRMSDLSVKPDQPSSK